MRQEYLYKIQTDITESTHVTSRLYAGFHIADQAKQILAHEEDKYQVCQEKLEKQILERKIYNKLLNDKKKILEENHSEKEEDFAQKKSNSHSLLEELRKQLIEASEDLYSESVLKNVQDLKNILLKILNSYSHLCFQYNQDCSGLIQQDTFLREY